MAAERVGAFDDQDIAVAASLASALRVRSARQGHLSATEAH